MLSTIHIEMGNTGDIPHFETIKSMNFDTHQRARIAWNRSRLVAGTPEVVKQKLTQLADDYNLYEIMIATMAENFKDRKRYYELIAEMFARFIKKCSCIFMQLQQIKYNPGIQGRAKGLINNPVLQI